MTGDGTVPAALADILLTPGEERLALDPKMKFDTWVITWKPRDWYWLNMHREYCLANPDDIASKLVYKRYLSWYRSN